MRFALKVLEMFLYLRVDWSSLRTNEKLTNIMSAEGWGRNPRQERYVIVPPFAEKNYLFFGPHQPPSHLVSLRMEAHNACFSSILIILIVIRLSSKDDIFIRHRIVERAIFHIRHLCRKDPYFKKGHLCSCIIKAHLSPSL